MTARQCTEEVLEVDTLGGWASARSPLTVAGMDGVSRRKSTTEPSALEDIDLDPTHGFPCASKTWRSVARLVLRRRAAHARSVAIREQHARETTSLNTLRKYQATEQAARKAAAGVAPT
jgi:hypothetical protein